MVLTQMISCDCGADPVQLSGDALEASAEMSDFILAHKDADTRGCHVHLDVVMEANVVTNPSRRVGERSGPALRV
jgi:hypothetical protein